MAMTLRLPETLDEQLKRQADSEHLSVHALVVKASREYVTRHGMNVEIDTAMAEIKATYGDALRRLGE